LSREYILLVGAIPVAIMAIIAELGMSALQKVVQPPVSA
jgi:osmoprotectant transport system permease protein